jgi:hypothetical protein
MMIHANHDNNTEPLRLRAARTVGAGEVEQRLTHGRWRFAAAGEQRGNSPLRAWRAPATEVGGAPQRVDRLSAMPDDKPAGRHPGAPTPTGPRPNGPDRMVRMRAIEQAWKAERARQAEFEAAQAESEARQALRQAEELETKRQADERIRIVLERAKRFRAAVSAEAGEQQPSGADRDRAGHRPRQRSKRGPSKARNGGGSARRDADRPDQRPYAGV